MILQLPADKMTIQVQAEDQGFQPRSKTAKVIVEIVGAREDLPPQWRAVGSTSLDQLTITIDEDQEVTSRLAEVGSKDVEG